MQKSLKAMTSLFVIALLALFFVTGCGSDDDNGGGTDTGSVTGTVTDSNGNPVSGATCTITTTETKATYTDDTDSSGVFLIPGIPGGTWPLTIGKTGFQTITLNVSVNSGSTTEVPADDTIISPTAGTGSVTGIVTDSVSSEAIESVTVTVGSTQATSSSTGAYNLGGITSGVQAITASKSGYDNYSSSVTVIADSTVTHNISMTSSTPEPGKGHVKGKVVDENGNGMPGVTVTSGTTTTTTDSNGEYTLMNLEPGQATLQFDKTGYDSATVNVTVVEDQAVTADTVTLNSGLTTGATVLCSVPRTTENGAKGANYSSCSDDGAFVTFLGDQPLLATHISNSIHTYLYSRSSGTVTMMDKSPEGLEGSFQGGVADCGRCHISGDASLIAFNTKADNLLGSGLDANAQNDVFVYQRSNGKVSRVSVDYSNPLLGGYGDDTKTTGANSSYPRLSRDGSYIAFRSKAKNIVAPGFITDGTNPHATWNIYRVKLTQGTNGVTASNPLLISGRQLDGKECDPADWAGTARTSEEPWISSDGRFVTYQTNALPGSNFVGGAGDSLLNGTIGYRDTGDDRDIVICDTEKTVQTRTSFVSGNADGVMQNVASNPCTNSSVSDDGTKIMFQCEDSNGRWINGNDATDDVWIKDLTDGSLIRISASGTGARGISAPGMISRDGTLAVFSSFDTGFVQNDTNGARDCFIYNLAEGTYTRVSLGSNNQQADKNSFRPYLSGDNNYVSFTSPAKNLVDNPYFTTGSFDVYLRKWQ